MRKTAQTGFAHLLLILVLVIGLVVGIYLVQQKTNIFSKASSSVSNPIQTPTEGRPTVVNVTRLNSQEISIRGRSFSLNVAIPLDYKYMVYVSTGGAIEYTAETTRIIGDELIVNVGSIAGAIARDAKLSGVIDANLLSNQYIRVCRTTPNYACSDYVTIPNLR